MKDDQGMWNFLFSLLFITVFGTALWYLWEEGRLPIAIPVFDFVLITLATFRLTRLFVYDKITQFVRDLFLRKEILEGNPGEWVMVRHAYVRGPFRTISELLACPWCFGVWAAATVAFFYFLTPYAWWPILVLAIAGVGTFLQLLSNMIGWKAEELKDKVEG